MLQKEFGNSAYIFSLHINHSCYLNRVANADPGNRQNLFTLPQKGTADLGDFLKSDILFCALQYWGSSGSPEMGGHPRGPGVGRVRGGR